MLASTGTYSRKYFDNTFHLLPPMILVDQHSFRHSPDRLYTDGYVVVSLQTPRLPNYIGMRISRGRW